MTERKLITGTDGFRGVYTDEPGPAMVNEETLALLSAALVEHVQEKGDHGAVVIARDTRDSGELLRNAVVDGVLTSGAEIIDLGIVPTPVAQKVAKGLGAAATIVITASHNPASDNGWKGMVGSEKPDQDEALAISNRYWDLLEANFKPQRFEMQAQLDERLLDTYMKDVVNNIESQFGEKPLLGKLFVIDGAHGAGSNVTPKIFESLGATVEEFACGPGEINKDVGAASLNGLITFLQVNPEITHDRNFVGAIANDGDADRVMGVGHIQNRGQSDLVEINGNHMMWAMGQDQLGIVGTEYTNSGLVEALDAKGVDFEYCANGDVNVTRALNARVVKGDNWTRGGEFTGHLVDTKWLSSGDGPRAGAWFAAWAVSNGMNFGDVHKELPLWHERMEKFTLRDMAIGEKLLEATLLHEEITNLESGLYGSHIRVVARPSGTEPVFRLWGESQDKESLNKGIDHASEILHELSGKIW